MPLDEGYGSRVSRGLEEFSPDPLTDLPHAMLRELITQAVEAELNELLAAHVDQTDAAGRRRLARHGLSARKGGADRDQAVPVKVPRARDQTPEGEWAGGL